MWERRKGNRPVKKPHISIDPPKPIRHGARYYIIGLAFAAVPALIMGSLMASVNMWAGIVAGLSIFGMGIDVLFNESDRDRNNRDRS